MASLKQLEILAQGVKAWNEWREQQPRSGGPTLTPACLRHIAPQGNKGRSNPVLQHSHPNPDDSKIESVQLRQRSDLLGSDFEDRISLVRELVCDPTTTWAPIRRTICNRSTLYSLPRTRLKFAKSPSAGPGWAKCCVRQRSH